MASAASCFTPRKTKEDSCVVCAKKVKNKSDMRNLNNVTAINKNIPQLLEKFGRVRYIDGYICRMCQSKLLRLNDKVENFACLCVETASKVGKRMMRNSPMTPQGAQFVSNTRPSKKFCKLFTDHVEIGNDIDTAVLLPSSSPLQSKENSACTSRSTSLLSNSPSKIPVPSLAHHSHLQSKENSTHSCYTPTFVNIAPKPCNTILSNSPSKIPVPSLAHHSRLHSKENSTLNSYTPTFVNIAPKPCNTTMLINSPSKIPVPSLSHILDHTYSKAEKDESKSKSKQQKKATVSAFPLPIEKHRNMLLSRE